MSKSKISSGKTNGKPVDAIVIGGGIAGCSLALELSLRDVNVVVLERSSIACESSGRNTGTLLCGQQREVNELLDACVEAYEEIAAGPISFEFGKIEHLLICEDDATYEQSTVVADKYRSAGAGMEPVSRSQLARDHPKMFNVGGGYFVDRAWTLEPMGATHAFAHAAREAGAELRTGSPVIQIVSRSGKVRGVLTDQGIVSADMVFIANGLWMPDLLRRTVGDGPLPPLPFTAGRGWLIQLGKVEFDMPWIVGEPAWPDQGEIGNRMSVNGLEDVADQKDDQAAVQTICLNPMRGGDARLGASVQPSLRDLLRNTDMPSQVARRALRMIPGLKSLGVTNAYHGHRSMLSDGMPVAGRTPIEGLYLHGCMSSIGMAVAPATARWLVEAVLFGDGNPQKPWLLPTRFPGWS